MNRTFLFVVIPIALFVLAALITLPTGLRNIFSVSQDPFSVPSDSADQTQSAAVLAALPSGAATAIQHLTNAPSGYTKFTVLEDTKIYFVSTTGSDSNDGLSPNTPLKSIQVAIDKTRDGSNDWVLLKAGDTFKLDTALGIRKKGRSPENKILISSYGTGARPIVETTGSANGIILQPRIDENKNYIDNVRNIAIVGIHFRSRVAKDPADGRNKNGSQGIGFSGPFSDILIEDVLVQGYNQNISTTECITAAKAGAPKCMDVYNRPTTYPRRNITVNRSVSIGAYQTIGGRPQGIYLGEVDGIRLTNNVFYHNGWNGDGVNSYNTIQTGVSNIPASERGLSHNAYLQYSNSSNVVVDGNIFADGMWSGLQLRFGGQVTNNLFLRNNHALMVGIGKSTVRDNVVLELKNQRQKSDWEVLRATGIEVKPMNLSVFERNIVAHSLDQANSEGIRVDNKVTYVGSDQDPASVNYKIVNTFVGRYEVDVKNNVVYGAGNAYRVENPNAFASGASKKIKVENNIFDARVNNEACFRQGYGTDTKNFIYGRNSFFCDQYNQQFVFSPRSSAPNSPDLQLLSFTQWAEKVENVDTRGTNAYAQRSFKDSSRTIGSYDRSIGGTGTYENFIQRAIQMSKSNYQTKYTAAAVNDYIRDGFNVTSSQPTSLTPTVKAGTVVTLPPGGSGYITGTNLQGVTAVYLNNAKLTESVSVTDGGTKLSFNVPFAIPPAVQPLWGDAYVEHPDRGKSNTFKLNISVPAADPTVRIDQVTSELVAGTAPQLKAVAKLTLNGGNASVIVSDKPKGALKNLAGNILTLSGVTTSGVSTNLQKVTVGGVTGFKLPANTEGSITYTLTYPASGLQSGNYQLILGNTPLSSATGNELPVLALGVVSPTIVVGAQTPQQSAVTAPAAGATVTVGQNYTVRWTNQNTQRNGYRLELGHVNRSGTVVLAEVPGNLQAVESDFKGHTNGIKNYVDAALAANADRCKFTIKITATKNGQALESFTSSNFCITSSNPTPPVSAWSASVTSFNLMNAVTDTVIDMGINENETYPLPLSGNEKLNILPVTTGSTVGSIVFTIKAPNGNTTTRTETNEPRAVFGDTSGGNLVEWIPETGTYTITATPYEKADAQGKKGATFSRTMKFERAPVWEAEVRELELMNAVTDQKITNIANNATFNLTQIGDKLNVLPAFGGDPVGSVVFTVKDPSGNTTTRTETNAPLAVFGDSSGGNLNEWTPQLGTYIFTATPYEKADAKGVKGTTFTRTVTFTRPSPEPAIASFSLINAVTDQVIAGYENITSNQTIRLSSLPSTRLNIRANVSAANSSTVMATASVKFGISPTDTSTQSLNNRVENEAPYALAGNDGNNYNEWIPQVKTYTISATPYSAANAGGTKGDTETIQITFTNTSAMQSGSLLSNVASAYTALFNLLFPF